VHGHSDCSLSCLANVTTCLRQSLQLRLTLNRLVDWEVAHDKGACTHTSTFLSLGFRYLNRLALQWPSKSLMLEFNGYLSWLLFPFLYNRNSLVYFIIYYYSRYVSLLFLFNCWCTLAILVVLMQNSACVCTQMLSSTHANLCLYTSAVYCQYKYEYLFDDVAALVCISRVLSVQ
jgi:hypothetical protein